MSNVWRLLATQRVLSAIRGMLAGAACTLLWLATVGPLQSIWGGDWRVIAAGWLGVLCGAVVASWLPRQRWTIALLGGALTTTLSAPWLWRFAAAGLEFRFAGTALSPVAEGVLLFCVLGPITAPCGAAVFSTLREVSGRDRRSPVSWLSGSLVACVCGPLVVGLGLPTAILLILVAGSWTATAIDWRRTRSENGSAEEDAESTASLSASTRMIMLGVAALAGGAWALSTHIHRPLLGTLDPGGFCLLAGVMIGLSLACATPLKAWRRMGLVPAIMGLGVSLAYMAWTPLLLTSLRLRMAAWINSPELLFVCGTLLGACIATPAIFFTAGALRAAAGSTFRPQWALPLTGVALLAYAGSFSLNWPLATATRFWTAFALVLACAVGALPILRGASRMTARTRRNFAGGLACLVLAGVMAGAASPRPFAAADLLLASTRMLVGLRQGYSPRELEALDGGRPLAEFGSLAGRWSVWSHRGSHWLSRRNGLAVESRSIDPTACPQNLAEILPALLPLVTRAAPEHVLVWGMHTPTLTVCEQWPLRSVTVTDPDPAAFSVLDWQRSHPERPLVLGAGPEVKPVRGGVVCPTAHLQPHSYDIIVAPRPPAWEQAPLREAGLGYFASMRSLLRDGGIFCQRFVYYDLGPRSAADWILAFQSVFPEMVTYESAPGELLLLGSQDGEPLLTPEMCERLKSPQSRRLLAEAGGDWASLWARGALQSGDIERWATSLGAASRSERDRPYRLAREIHSWNLKAEATRSSLGRFSRVAGAVLEGSPLEEEVSHRLSDLQLAHKLIQDHPDDPWPYRAALKKRLKDRGRSVIQQVRHEGLKRVLDPEDKRRQNYLQALGVVARQPSPIPEDVLALTAFTQPFDPLLSHFVHFEVVALLERGGANGSAELTPHLLHSVFYSSLDDRSVRNVCSALDALSAGQDFEHAPGERWDLLVALLEVLEHRWRLRLHDESQAKYEPLDTEHSIHAVERALAALDSLQAPLCVEHWETRKALIERRLLSPLRKHRTQQLKVYNVATGVPATDEITPATATY